MKTSKLNLNKDNSIFDLNIPRKINYNNSFNKTIIDYNNNKFKTSKKQQFRKVSKFNPYDIGYLKLNIKDDINKTGIKPKKANFNYINNTDNESANKENESIISNILTGKNAGYINSNKKCSQNLLMKFNTPKTGMNLGIVNKNTPEYLIKIKNQKKQYFTDLKKALNNMKIKSTNYSSNGSYNITENNNYDEGYYNKETKLKDSSFNKKIKKININKSNKQFFPKALKTLEKYLKIKSKLKLQSKEKKNKLRENKSANNLKVSNKNKYIMIGHSKNIKEDNNSSNKKENIGITKANSFLNSVLYCCYCCGDE